MLNTRQNKPRFAPSKLSLLAAAACAAGISTSAHAFNIDTGNPDIDMRWDNAVRYNAGWRMEEPNSHFANAYGANNFGNAESETHFKKGAMVTNRLDLLSELDFAYQGNYGFRISAALWSENAYGSKSSTNPQIDGFYNAIFPGIAPSSVYGPSGNYSAYARRYATGSSAEFLDAFVFGNFQIGETSLNLKLGQHNIYWGEALYTIADGVSAGQGPINTIKAATSPGAEAKELFMPLNQISGQWQLAQDLSINAQYLMDWKPYRITPGGTYFAPGDGAGNPPCASVYPLSAAGGCISSLEDITPGRNGGDYGLALRWSPKWLDGTMGFYYRKYDEKLPWSTTQLNIAAVNGQGVAPTNMGVRLSYARDTELLGISLAKAIGGVSVGTELSYRHNSALNSVSGFFAGSGSSTPATLAYFGSAAAATPLTTALGYEQFEGARGDTVHAVLNGIWLLPKTALWEGGVLQGEFAYQRLDKVTKNANLYYATDYACKFGYAPGGIAPGSRDKGDGCATKDSLALSVGFAPEWTQVFPGWDLSMPTFLSYGIKGNSPTLGGSHEGAYNWSIGLKAKYASAHEFSLAYNDSHADYRTTTATSGAPPANNLGLPGAQVVSTTNGGAAANNRGWLSFTFKTSF